VKRRFVVSEFEVSRWSFPLRPLGHPLAEKGDDIRAFISLQIRHFALNLIAYFWREHAKFDVYASLHRVD
jgi:hypothetical protein